MRNKKLIHAQVYPELHTPVYNYNDFVLETEISINSNYLKIESGLPLKIKINDKSARPIRNVTKFLLKEYQIDKIYVQQELSSKQYVPVFISFWNGDIETEEKFKNIPVVVKSNLTPFNLTQSITLTFTFNSGSEFGSDLIGFKMLSCGFVIKTGNLDTAPISTVSDFTKILIVEASDNGEIMLDYGSVGPSVDKAVIRYVPVEPLILPKAIEVTLYRNVADEGEYGQAYFIGEPIYH